MIMSIVGRSASKLEMKPLTSHSKSLFPLSRGGTVNADWRLGTQPQWKKEERTKG